MTNQNTNEYLEKIKQRLFENLRMLPHAPGVQMQAIPEDAIPEESGDEDEEDPDKRISICSSDKRIACEEEFSDSDEEGEGGRKNSSNFKKAKRVKTEDEKEKEPEEKKEITEEEKTKEDKQEAKGVKEEVKLAWADLSSSGFSPSPPPFSCNTSDFIFSISVYLYKKYIKYKYPQGLNRNQGPEPRTHMLGELF